MVVNILPTAYCNSVDIKKIYHYGFKMAFRFTITLFNRKYKWHFTKWCLALNDSFLKNNFPTCDEGIRPWLFLPPGWDKHSDVFMSFFHEPFNSKLDTTAREYLFVSMATKQNSVALRKSNEQNIKCIPKEEQCN